MNNPARTIGPDALMADARVERFPRPKQPASCTSANALESMTFPPIKYVIPGFVVEGLTIFAGRPKLGKSWCCLDWAGAVASGGVAFGSVECEQGDVLYLALEDNLRRLKSRLEKVLPNGGWPQRLALQTECERLDRGGLDAIRRWAGDVANPRLVIIDVFARVRPERKSTDTQYDADYHAMQSLHGLANELGLAVVVVTHVRKLDAEDPLDTVSGTLGFAGAADSVLVLNRDSQGVTLYGRGRDIEEIETAMQFDKQLCRWTVLGPAIEVRRSDERKRITEALESAAEPMGPNDIADVTGMPSGNIRRLLSKMVEDGQIGRMGRGKYIPADPGNNGNIGLAVLY